MAVFLTVWPDYAYFGAKDARDWARRFWDTYGFDWDTERSSGTHLVVWPHGTTLLELKKALDTDEILYEEFEVDVERYFGLGGRRRSKTAFGDGKLIRGRIQWRGTAPPVVGVGGETINTVRQRVVDVLSALVTVLLRHAKLRGFPAHEENLFDFFNKRASDEFNVIVDTLQQADGHVKVGHLNSALMYYLNTLELVLDAKCYYGTNPDGAFD